MSAIFTCVGAQPNNGIQQITLTRSQGQPNYIYLNVVPAVLKDIFGAEVRDGDVWSLKATLVSRAGTNGKKRD